MNSETTTSPDYPVIWVLRDERPGTGNQALGVADALKKPYVVKDLRYGIFGRLPNLLIGSSLRALMPAAQAEITPPWPDLVISAGRRAAAVACYIKLASASKSFVFHLMYPGPGPTTLLNIVAVPAHDKVAGTNIVTFTTAPNRVTRDILHEAGAKWSTVWEGIQNPVLGVLVGGPGRGMPFNDADAGRLASQIAKWKANTSGSVLVTTSRRSGKRARALFENLAAGKIKPDLFHTWDAEGENPFLGILAVSEVLLVTGDSVSMLSEACASRGNVYIYRSPDFTSAKHLRFHDKLIELGAARLSDEIVPGWTAKPINSANDLAGLLAEKLGW